MPSDKVQDVQVSFESDGQLETSYRFGFEFFYFNLGQLSIQLNCRKMRFTVRENHFSQSSLVVKCNANIGEAYWQTSQVVIQIIGKPRYVVGISLF